MISIDCVNLRKQRVQSVLCFSFGVNCDLNFEAHSKEFPSMTEYIQTCLCILINVY